MEQEPKIMRTNLLVHKNRIAQLQSIFHWNRN